MKELHGLCLQSLQLWRTTKLPGAVDWCCGQFGTTADVEASQDVIQKSEWISRIWASLIVWNHHDDRTRARVVIELTDDGSSMQ